MEAKISVIIPAHNEEKQIQRVIKTIRGKDIVNQIIVVDNASTDRTQKLARQAGAEIVECPQKGKGYAMEKGLKCANNGIVVFIDGDIANYSKDLIYKLANPIINDEADFVKSMFERQGGRVTELVAKPMLDILFPDIYKFSQPLSGMIAAKKSLLDKIEFEKDYGVDIGILLDVIALGARVEEAHIGKLNNISQKWQALEEMSKQVMRAILKRANINNDKN